MSYNTFEQKIRSRFGRDVLSVYHENGKHIAKLVGDIRIIGNSLASSITVKWGDGHIARASL